MRTEALPLLESLGEVSTAAARRALPITPIACFLILRRRVAKLCKGRECAASPSFYYLHKNCLTGGSELPPADPIPRWPGRPSLYQTPQRTKLGSMSTMSLSGGLAGSLSMGGPTCGRPAGAARRLLVVAAGAKKQNVKVRALQQCRERSKTESVQTLGWGMSCQAAP